MRIEFSSLPGSADKTNEDWAGASLSTVVVLDGVTSPGGMPTGCQHNVPWYVNHLGLRLLVESTTHPDSALRDCLAAAISSVAEMHSGTCDLTSPGTPMATVATLRIAEGGCDYLVLSDATLVLDMTSGVEVISDKGVSGFAAAQWEALRKTEFGTPENSARMRDLVAEQRRYRNQPGGYWLAAADPQAAEHALTGAVPLSGLEGAAIMTDGISAMVDTYAEWTWRELLDALAQRGTEGVLAAVRDVESGDPTAARWPRFKISDDATVAYVTRRTG